jgi:sigma-B regulation protein RsbU (phosphoserine phosphatase)
MRIIIAEDERITRLSLARQLEAWGHQVVAAEDGEAAWERIRAEPFDIVITDWEMPRLPGPELIRRIRSAPGAAFVYIVMLTGRGKTADLVAGIEAGADDFVAKPFDKDELRVRLLAGERIVKLERTLSLQNAQLREAQDRMSRDLEAAARVQRATLPSRAINTPRARTAWKYVPTDALAGDTLGIHLLDDRYLVAYVADVSGHGVPAALLAVTFAHALAPEPAASSLLRDASGGGAAGLGSVREPARVARALNDRFRSEQSDGRFLTLILCVLDTHTGALRIGSAGHPPPLVLRGDGEVPVGETDGFPIGLIEGAEYSGTSLTLAPGDRVVLFSDGILEQTAHGSNAMFGLARFAALARSLHAAPCDRILSATVDALSAWCGGQTFADDVSMVVLEWLGPPGAP